MRILGWEIINPLKKDVKELKAIVPKDDDSGAYSPSSGTTMSSFFSFEQNHVSDIDLITKYRQLIFIPEVDMAIEEIINEMIISSENEDIAILNLDNLKVSDSFKETIKQEFEHILNLLDFQNNAYELARRWYIDGRLFFHILINMKNPKSGIIDIRQIDALNIKKVKEVEKGVDENQIPIIKSVKEYFIYSEQGLKSSMTNTDSIRLSVDSVAYATSGLIDPSNGIVISNLHKAMKIANHLSMVETALVIYRLVRAPERRVFYIDTGDLPKAKAEEYLQEQMKRHRNKLTYDVSTGQVLDQKSILSMLEDYWLPRRGGTRGTEIQQLDSGANLQNLEDVEYFKQKLYKALNVPLLRLQPDASVSYSKDTAIIREELKFSKFIDKLRKKFSFFLYDLLRKQLILKGMITPNDWMKIKGDIFITFQKDSFYSEIKEAELLSDRISLLNDINPYVGTLISNQYVYKTILQMSDDEIETMKEQIAEEKELKKRTKQETEPEDTSFYDTSEGFDAASDLGEVPEAEAEAEPEAAAPVEPPQKV